MKSDMLKDSYQGNEQDAKFYENSDISGCLYYCSAAERIILKWALSLRFS